MALRATVLTRKYSPGDAGALLRKLAESTQRQFGHSLPLCPPVRRADSGQYAAPSGPCAPLSEGAEFDSPDPDRKSVV